MLGLGLGGPLVNSEGILDITLRVLFLIGIGCGPGRLDKTPGLDEGKVNASNSGMSDKDEEEMSTLSLLPTLLVKPARLPELITSVVDIPQV